MARRASEPYLRVPSPAPVAQNSSRNSPLPRSPSQSSPAPQSVDSTSVGTSPRQSSPSPKVDFDQAQLRSVLEKLLPAEDPRPPAIEDAKPQSIGGYRPRGNESRQCEVTQLPLPTTTAETDAKAPGRQRKGSWSSAAEAEVCVKQPALGANRSRCVQGKAQVLERFRWRILQRFRSLFDAFARLHDLATRENALSQDEFCQAFAQVGIKESEALEAFSAMNSKDRQLVSLAELRSALCTTSKEALLWELRCRLMTQGITPNDLSKVKKILEVARRPRHRTVRQRRRSVIAVSGISGSATNAADDQSVDGSVEESEADWAATGEATYAWAERFETATGFLPSSCRLSRTDWLQVCAAIGLTLGEAERLFPLLANSATEMVDLQEMFAVLRAGVAPQVSLERFATRVLTRYGSLQSAFATVCGDAAKPSEKSSAVPATGGAELMRWNEFHTLAVALDVQDGNAEGLWSALTLAQQSRQQDGTVISYPQEGDSTPASTNAQQEVDGITEATFVKELSMWAPGTALQALRHQLDEHFSDLSEFRYALSQTGISLSAPLSPAELNAALSAVGVLGCNVEGVTSAIQNARRGRRNRGSLDDVLDALQGSVAFHGSAAQGAVRDDMRRFWQTLHTVQADLQGDDGDTPRLQPGLELVAYQVPAEPQCSMQHLKTCNLQRGEKTMRPSASLPSLRSAGGLRSRASRQFRGRIGLACCG